MCVHLYVCVYVYVQKTNIYIYIYTCSFLCMCVLCVKYNDLLHWDPWGPCANSGAPNPKGLSYLVPPCPDMLIFLTLPNGGREIWLGVGRSNAPVLQPENFSFWPKRGRLKQQEMQPGFVATRLIHLSVANVPFWGFVSHHLQICVGDYIPNSLVMFMDIFQPLFVDGFLVMRECYLAAAVFWRSMGPSPTWPPKGSQTPWFIIRIPPF